MGNLGPNSPPLTNRPCVDHKEEQRNEIEALQAIYFDEFKGKFAFTHS
jgi:hypothetical protein